MVMVDPRHGIPVEPDEAALKRLSAIRKGRRRRFLARYGGLFFGCLMAVLVFHYLVGGPSWLGPLGAVAAALACLGLVVRFVNLLGYLLTPVLEAELWYFPGNEAELTACQIAVSEGRMETRHFPEYGVSYRAFRWRLGCDPGPEV